LLYFKITGLNEAYVLCSGALSRFPNSAFCNYLVAHITLMKTPIEKDDLKSMINYYEKALFYADDFQPEFKVYDSQI